MKPPRRFPIQSSENLHGGRNYEYEEKNENDFGRLYALETVSLWIHMIKEIIAVERSLLLSAVLIKYIEGKLDLKVPSRQILPANNPAFPAVPSLLPARTAGEYSNRKLAPSTKCCSEKYFRNM